MSETTSSNSLIRRLKQTLLRQRLVFFVAGLFATVAVVLAMSVVLSLLAAVIILPVAAKITLLAVSGILGLAIFIKFAAGRLLSGTVEQVAVTLEGAYPRLKGRLIAAIQFSRMKNNPGYSRDLIALTERQALVLAGEIDFGAAVTFNSLLRAGRYLAITAVIAVGLLVLSPALFSHSYHVYSNTTTVIAPPLGYTLAPFPGTVEWVKYRDIEFGAAVVGDRLPERVKVHYRLAGGSWQESELALDPLTAAESESGDSIMVSIRLRQINRSFDYWVEAGRVRTETQQINVVDRPRVTGIRLSLIYPDYTELPPTVIDENNGSFSAVTGTRVSLSVRTNLPIETAELVYLDSSRVPMRVGNKQAETSLVVDKSRAYYIHLTDHLGESNPDPIEYYLTAVPDEYPSAEVIRPGFDVNLGDEMILPLMVRIFDDYGFTSLVMKYSVFSRGEESSENVAVLHFSDRIKTEGEIEFNWDMDQLNLFPGDFVRYYFEVADNDRVSGPKLSRSRQYIARLPSLDEIVAETEGRTTRRIIRTEELLKTGLDLTERLKNISRKIQAQSRLQNQSDNWQQQKELEAVTDKNAELVDEIEKLADQMEKSVDELNDKALMSREILEKLSQIQKLFEEIATPEMKEARRKLMEAMERMNPDEIREALKNFEMTQKELLERLERTLALLKKLQLEQKMEAMVRRTEELARRQEEMNNQTDSSSSKDLPQLSDKEDEIRSDLEQLKEELDQLAEMAQEAGLEDAPELEEFEQALSETDADQDMQQMSDAMNQKQKEQATEKGQKALSKLLKMLDTMQQQLASMKGDQDEELMRAMRRAVDDANHLSQDQEALLREAAAMNRRSSMLQELAQDQQNLQRSCNGLGNRIREIGEKSPFMAAELQQLIGSAVSEMDAATGAFTEQRGSQGLQHQREAMARLNRAALRILESLNQQSQCSKGGNCDKSTSDIQSLSEKQNQLNQKTQSQCNNPGQAEGNGMSDDGRREALQRLAGEQGSIRKSLEDLSQEFGGSRQILGRLDDIADEMKKVEEALSTGEAGQEVVERQLKIFSRMLEAGRSLYRKDFTEQRKSKTATNPAFMVPPQLTNDILGDRVRLEDRLRQYLGENYPPQYEEQIKAYFKALLQIETQAINGEPAGSPPQPTEPSQP